MGFLLLKRPTHSHISFPIPELHEGRLKEQPNQPIPEGKMGESFEKESKYVRKLLGT